jgi:hypothetical protein
MNVLALIPISSRARGAISKAFLNPYNRKGDCILVYHLEHYMYAAISRAEHADEFTKCFHLVANTD